MIKVTGGGLIAELRRRRAKLAIGHAGVILWAFDSVKWWYYHEFGTAGGYSIDPHGDYLLRWPEPNAQGGWREVTHVKSHPGVKPKKFVAMVLEDIREMAGRTVITTLLDSDYDMAAIQEAMMNEIGPEAKKLVVDSMAQQLHQTREAGTGGKLNNESPANVFERETELRPI